MSHSDTVLPLVLWSSSVSYPKDLYQKTSSGETGNGPGTDVVPTRPPPSCPQTSSGLLSVYDPYFLPLCPVGPPELLWTPRGLGRTSWVEVWDGPLFLLWVPKRLKTMSVGPRQRFTILGCKLFIHNSQTITRSTTPVPSLTLFQEGSTPNGGSQRDSEAVGKVVTAVRHICTF